MTSHSHLRNPQLYGIAGIAALIGALTALFASPRSGADNRKMVRDQAVNMRDRMIQTKHGIEEAKEEVKEAPKAAKTVQTRATTRRTTTRRATPARKPGTTTRTRTTTTPRDNSSANS